MPGLHESPFLIATTVAGAFVAGIVIALLGSIKLPLAQRLGIDETRVGWLLAAMNVALIPMMLVGGILVDKWGVKGVLLAGSLGVTLGLGLLVLSRNFMQ